MSKKTVKAPLSYDPGKGRPKEHLAYLNWQEMQELQRINGGNMERGPKGLPSFPPADAIGSSSRSVSSRGPGGGSLSSPSRTSGSYYRGTPGGGGGADRGRFSAGADAARRQADASRMQAEERARRDAASRAEKERRNRDERAKREAEARNARTAISNQSVKEDAEKAIKPTVQGGISGAISSIATVPKPYPKPSEQAVKPVGGYTPPTSYIPSRDEIISHLRREAIARNIDPDIVIQGVRSEGLNANPEEGWQSNIYNKKGVRERSYGPFQLNVDAGRLGAQFKSKTGLDPSDPRTVFAQNEFSLDTLAKQKGWGNKSGWTWFGPKDTGMSKTRGFENARPLYGSSSYSPGITPRSIGGVYAARGYEGMPGFKSTKIATRPSVSGPATSRAAALSSSIKIVPASAPGVSSVKDPKKLISSTESAYRDPFAVAGKRAVLSTTPSLSVKAEKANEPSVEPDTPPGYFAQFAVTPQDMVDLKNQAIKDYGIFSKQLSEMNKNKDALPAFFGPISRDVDRVAALKSVKPTSPIGSVANKYPQSIGPPSPSRMADAATQFASGISGGISDLFGASAAEASTPEGQILARGYMPYGMTGTERKKMIYDRVPAESGTISERAYRPYGYTGTEKAVEAAPRRGVTAADIAETQYGVMVDESGSVSNVMRSPEYAPEDERVELERMRREAIREAAKRAGFRPGVYESEEFQSDINRLGMMPERPGEISPTDMAKLVSRSMDTVLKEKYGEEPTGGYLTRAEKDRLAASNVIKRVMSLNPLARIAVWGAEKLTKPEDVRSFLARPSYEQEELYRLGRELDERYGRRPVDQVAGRDVYAGNVVGRGDPMSGTRGGELGGSLGGGIGGLGGGTSGGFGSGGDSGDIRPYIYFQWDVGVNIPSPGDPLYTQYQEYLKTKETAPSA